MVTVEEWIGWLQVRWTVFPVAEGEWAIGMRDNVTPANAMNHLGIIFDDEEVAGHVCRAHNYYLSALQGAEAREELAVARGSEPSEP